MCVYLRRHARLSHLFLIGRKRQFGEQLPASGEDKSHALNNLAQAGRTRVFLSGEWQFLEQHDRFSPQATIWRSFSVTVRYES